MNGHTMLNWIKPENNEGLTSARRALESDDLLVLDYSSLTDENKYQFRNNVIGKTIWNSESTPSGYDALYTKKHNPRVKIYYYTSLRATEYYIKASDMEKVNKNS